MDLLSNNDNCYSTYYTTCDVRCLICTKNVSLLPGKVHPAEVSEIYSDLLDVLCKYMKWTITSKYRFDFTHDAFPFCEKCVLFVVKLYKLHEQLEETLEKLNKVIIGISGRILISPKSNVRKRVNVKRENPKVLHASKFMYVIGTEEKCEYYRRQLYRRFTPSVKLQVDKSGAPCPKRFIDCESGLPKQPLPIELKLEVDPLSISFAYGYEYQNVDLCSNQLNDDQITSLQSNDSEYPTISNLYPRLANPLSGEISFTNEPDSIFSGEYTSGGSSRNIQHEHRNIDFPGLDEQVLGRPQPLASEISDFSNSREMIDSNSKLNVCETCGKKFLTISSLKKHQMVHRSGLPFCCELCGKCFKSSVDEMHHKAAVHIRVSDKKFICHVCGQKFERIDLLRAHSTKHDKIRCYICAQNVTKSLFKIHMRTHNTGKTFKCDCNKSFKSCWQFNNHLKNHASISSSYKCDMCGKSFSNKYNVVRHKKNVHAIIEEESKGATDCDNLQGDHENLVKSQADEYYSANMKNSEKPNSEASNLVCSIESIFECPQCAKSFASYSGLHHHSKVHTRSKEFPCHLCSKTFNRRTKLIQHGEKHHNLNKETEHGKSNSIFQSDVSDVAQDEVKQTKNLYLIKNDDTMPPKLHGLVDSTKTLFQCSKCNIKFRSPKNLARHLKSHDNQFSCDVCGRNFSQKFSLKRHKNRVHCSEMSLTIPSSEQD